MNNETRTSSILQRLPVILAVTAASYGLPLQAQTARGAQPQSVAAKQIPAQPQAQR